MIFVSRDVALLMLLDSDDVEGRKTISVTKKILNDSPACFALNVREAIDTDDCFISAFHCTEVTKEWLATRSDAGGGDNKEKSFKNILSHCWRRGRIINFSFRTFLRIDFYA